MEQSNEPRSAQAEPATLSFSPLCRVKTTTITLAAARQRLTTALLKVDESVGIYGHASLGQRVYNLESGIRSNKERAVRLARQVVETMEARGLDRLDKLTIHGDAIEDPGFSTVYLSGGAVLLVQHSSSNRTGLGVYRKAQLDRFLGSCETLSQIGGAL